LNFAGSNDFAVQAFHRRLFSDPAFCDGDIDIQFLDRRPELLTLADDPALARDLAIAAALAEDAARGRRAPPPNGGAGGGESAWLLAARRDGVR
jgi:acetyl/propionyl-CoA carboxylase alpha subunit